MSKNPFPDGREWNDESYGWIQEDPVTWGPFSPAFASRAARVLCPVAKRLRNPKRQDRGSHRNYYNRHTLRYKGHKYKQPKRPKRNRYWKKRDLFKFYRFAGIQPEDLEEDEERRTPHSATNSTGSPPHRRDSPKDLGMGKKIGEEVGVEVGMKGPRELRDQTRANEDEEEEKRRTCALTPLNYPGKCPPYHDMRWDGVIVLRDLRLVRIALPEESPLRWEDFGSTTCLDHSPGGESSSERGLWIVLTD